MLRGPKLPGADELPNRPLSVREFNARYGASKRDADEVSQVLRKLGLKIEDVSLPSRCMKVSGTVAQMEAAFHPGLGTYKSAEQGEFRDRQSDYKVPPSLKKIVKAILGFGQRNVAKRRPARAAARSVRRLKKFEPIDIERHYHFPPGDAAGQRIAVAEFGGGYIAGDLAAYCRKFKRPVPRVKTISIDARILNETQMERLKPKKRSDDEFDSTGEVMMDVEIIAGLCPKAEISVYFAKDHQKGWVDLINRAIDDKPVVLSISWGASEEGGGWSKAALTAINEALTKAALLGITVCGAAGDDGSGDVQTNMQAHVDFPGSSPFVLAVGGTMMGHKSGKTVEKVWRVGKGKRIRGRGGATGGGVSSTFDRPSWQKAHITSVNKKGKNGRVVPDVAALAGSPGYDMIFRGKDDYGGGTSASTPLWAALIARVNALLPRSQRRRFLTRLLYQDASHGGPLGQLVCHDVTIGNNITRPKPDKGFNATKGFDAVSGWGTPIGTALLLALT
jgi:kumamolisin